jgi:hypothetical protein
MADDELSNQLTPDEAAAAIEVAAWAEHPGDEAYRDAVEAIGVMLAERPGPFTADEIRAVISEHVPEPRNRIHTRAGGLGADWDADDAVRFARQPGAVCRWSLDLVGHDLQVVAGDRWVQFEARAPGPVREWLLAEMRKRLAEADNG